MKEVCAKCVEKTGINPAIVADLQNGKISDDPLLMKHIHCFTVEMGYATESGDMNFEALSNDVEKIPLIKVSDPVALVEECRGKSLKGSTPEETIFVNFKCIMGIN